MIPVASAGMMPARENAAPHLTQDNSIMDFEDNWAYPWPNRMYDPVLKVILQPSHGREPEQGDASFAVYYDPEMIPGYYSRPKTAQEREQDLRYASSARFVDDPIAVESKLRRNIFEVPPRSFRAQAEISGNTLRVKFLKQFQSADETRGDELYWANAHLDGIEKSNVPIISAFPREFLIYILKSYINLPGLPDDADFPLAFHPNLRRIEMCVLPTVMTEILKLDPTACESRARLVLSCSTGFEPMTSFEEAAGQTLSGWTKADGLTGLTDTERDA